MFNNNNGADLSDYWRQRASEASYYEEIVQNQRNEIEALQRRCQELQYERVMGTAGVAMDVRTFITNNSVLAAPLQGHHGRPGPSQMMVPAAAAMNYLSELSNGLCPPAENARKRVRGSGAATTAEGAVPQSPVARAVQRFMFLQRKPMREGDLEDLLEQQHQQQALQQQQLQAQAPGPLYLPPPAAAAS